MRLEKFGELKEESGTQFRLLIQRDEFIREVMLGLIAQSDLELMS